MQPYKMATFFNVISCVIFEKNILKLKPTAYLVSAFFAQKIVKKSSFLFEFAIYVKNTKDMSKNNR